MSMAQPKISLLPKEPLLEEDLIDLKEVGRRLGVERRKVYWLINNQGLPVVLLGNARKVRPSALTRWIAEQEVRRQGA